MMISSRFIRPNAASSAKAVPFLFSLTAARGFSLLSRRLGPVVSALKALRWLRSCMRPAGLARTGDLLCATPLFSIYRKPNPGRNDQLLMAIGTGARAEILYCDGTPPRLELLQSWGFSVAEMRRINCKIAAHFPELDCDHSPRRQQGTHLSHLR